MSHPPITTKIRVALVEDDVNFQNVLKAAIETAPDMDLFDVTGTRELGLRMLEGPPADVLLIDLGLPDGSGIDVIREGHLKWPGCNIMVSTTFGDETNVIQSLEAGASGYLLKDSEPKKMIFEIRSLYAGGSPISPMIARQILMRFRSALAPAPASEAEKMGEVLSKREREVLEYITKGFTTDEIAKLLLVSRHTVLTYVRRVYAKLEVTSKTEAVYEARKRGLLKTDC